MEAILLISHGSRSNEAEKTFFRVAEEFEKFIGMKVYPTFMEFNRPGIEMAIENMYSDGVRKIIAMPYFLYSGIHIKEDVPEMLKCAKEKYNDLIIEFVGPIDFHPLMLEILKERLEDKRVRI
ncbi:Sirohydrochlorin cobaltochelatase [Caloramator mitchellensis]|uniref:Sirohydrochlorin cobaltochelatase n=1 Tax=Caloramator mitchellensis TaxID=908809 RepID=A0A0R3JR34_CALMK|nr:CbiX/SirB N-terminal domain-containing protein [Caloramator mitchellensis]KRQ85920.1 Sirohydrochlorin cobaltochelatase [Caloramator mitchellensis]